MTSTTGAPVVVGIDGSPAALAAVEIAAAEAALRRRPLRIVHAFVWPTISTAYPPAALGTSLPVFRDRAEVFVADAVQLAEKVAPEVAVTGEVQDGPAVPVLLDESRRAHLVVLGDRGLGGFAGLILGSVAVQMATHGRCPVLVVRGERRSGGPVVVGVDGSRTSARAFAFAVEEAALRGTDVLAVHTWQMPAVAGPAEVMPLVYDVALVEDEERRVLGEAVAGVAERYPDVVVRQEVVRGAAGRALVERSRGAQLVVVGDRGHGGFIGLLLGSVSQHLIHHAGCPVAVVRGERDHHGPGH